MPRCASFASREKGSNGSLATIWPLYLHPSNDKLAVLCTLHTPACTAANTNASCNTLQHNHQARKKTVLTKMRSSSHSPARGISEEQQQGRSHLHRGRILYQTPNHMRCYHIADKIYSRNQWMLIESFCCGSIIVNSHACPLPRLGKWGKNESSAPECSA